MDANELPGIKFATEVGDGFAQHVSMAVYVQATVIIRRFNPVDLIRGKKNRLRFGIEDVAA